VADARCIITFPNTHHALRGERVAKSAGIPVKMLPVPRDISADCNVGMAPPSGRGQEVLALLQAEKVDCRLAMRQ